MKLRAILASSSLAVSAVLAEAPKPAFPGADTAVVVHRTSGRVAVSSGGRLLVFERFGVPTPLLELDLPGIGGTVRELAGANLVYSTTGLDTQPLTYVAITVAGVERLAWPNEGLSERFPTQTSRLTVDGKGLYDRLVLDSAIREYFELPEDIPDGAGVIATFRFAGEKMAARASEDFGAALGLAPDDVLVVHRRGGVLRYRSGQGVAWQLGKESGGEWRLLDASLDAGTALALDGRGALVAIDLEPGTERWRWEAAEHEKDLAAWLGEPIPPTEATPARPPAGKGAQPTPTPTPLPRPGSRIVDARLLADGRVLVLGSRGTPWLGVLDGPSGVLAGQELLTAAERQGLATVASLWREKAAYLAWVQEVATPVGPALLLKGFDGWYAVPVPAAR